MRNHQFGQLPRALVVAAAFVVAALNAGSAEAACDAVCQTAFVTEHNNVRAKVSAGVEPGPNGPQPTPATPLPAMTLGTSFAPAAQQYADACTFAHSQPAQRPGRGENLYAASGPAPLTAPADAVSGPFGWESENVLYTYGTIPAPNQNEVGHYTQLVWANSTQVACGVTTCNVNSPFGAQFPEWHIVVCQYSPAGNIIGQAPYVAGAPAPRGPLDVDGNGQYDAKTDGLLILRYLFGITGDALTAGAIGPNATRNTPDLVLTHLTAVRAQLDIDGNGTVDALTDGMLIIRHLFGLRGAHLVNSAVGSGATRGSSNLIELYIDTLRP